MFYSRYVLQHEKKLYCHLRNQRLIKQYVVDPYCETETEKLSYLKEHQGQPQAPSYGRIG